MTTASMGKGRRTSGKRPIVDCFRKKGIACDVGKSCTAVPVDRAYINDTCFDVPSRGDHQVRKPSPRARSSTHHPK
jgi:hypothetical protein